jgi:hypothetical protein
VKVRFPIRKLSPGTGAAVDMIELYSAGPRLPNGTRLQQNAQSQPDHQAAVSSTARPNAAPPPDLVL